MAEESQKPRRVSEDSGWRLADRKTKEDRKMGYGAYHPGQFSAFFSPPACWCAQPLTANR